MKLVSHHNLNDVTWGHVEKEAKGLSWPEIIEPGFVSLGMGRLLNQEICNKVPFGLNIQD